MGCTSAAVDGTARKRGSVKKLAVIWLELVILTLCSLTPFLITLVLLYLTNATVIVTILAILFIGIPSGFTGGHVGLGLAMRLDNWADKNAH